jgi:hypothetical protein
MIEEVMSAYGGRLVIAILGVGIGLVCLIGILWIMRGRGGPSPFVRGGRNRQPRLQVLDAAAVDARRRLVLVRRDDVEHLIMIGGPTDIVIESGISGNASSRAASETPIAAQAAQVSEISTQALPRPTAANPENRVKNATETLPREPQRLAAAPMPAIPVAPPRLEPVPAARSAAIPGPMPVATQAEISPAPQATMPAREQKSEPRSPALSPAPAAPMTAATSAASPLAASPLAAASPAVDEAANALDAARSRVFVDRPEPEPPQIVPISAATVPASLQPAAEKPKMLGSDFEKILEEEMASNLAAREATIIAQPNRQTPQRDPAIPPVTGATADPSLQDEVARIFGEMSATRDK